MTFTVVSNTKLKNMELRSSIFIINSDAQKQLIEFGFECRFHDLNYFEVGFFFMFLEFIFYLRASSQKLHKKTQTLCNFILYFQQILDIHWFNITYLHTTCIIF